MAKMFITDKEINFFNSLSKELIQRVVGQEIVYYSVAEQYTNVDDLYDEALKKVVYQPVLINALVLYEDPIQTSTNFSIDTVYNIEVYVHKYELEERKVILREGDFIGFGGVIYEIEKLTRPQITFGQIEKEVMYKAECRVSRESQFDIKKEE